MYKGVKLRIREKGQDRTASWFKVVVKISPTP
jgi:hypothetical protein